MEMWKPVISQKMEGGAYEYIPDFKPAILDGMFLIALLIYMIGTINDKMPTL